MKVLLTGATGQVGSELCLSCPGNIDLESPERSELDICNETAVISHIERKRPEVIINAAAFTAVDQAESERESAFEVNSTGPRNIARAAAAVGARLVHLSTDFVFDGRQNRPYGPEDQPAPISVYGRSKLEGEKEIRAQSTDAVILRSSWIYSRFGTNFVTTMLALMRERPTLGVVSDQIGSPTWARGLAGAIWEIVADTEIRGIFHWCDVGVASWYDLAVATQEIGLEMGLLSDAIPVTPIPTEAYPTPARRPRFSVLDASALAARLPTAPDHWRRALRRMLADLTEAGRA